MINLSHWWLHPSSIHCLVIIITESPLSIYLSPKPCTSPTVSRAPGSKSCSVSPCSQAFSSGSPPDYNHDQVNNWKRITHLCFSFHRGCIHLLHLTTAHLRKKTLLKLSFFLLHPPHTFASSLRCPFPAAPLTWSAYQSGSWSAGSSCCWRHHRPAAPPSAAEIKVFENCEKKTHENSGQIIVLELASTW